ncbi:MAG: hypothetical protein KAG82_11810 [Alcanivoracaceae bacterium]|nr:hypothetical protein [Alcanivoracaceae bacterium]
MSPEEQDDYLSARWTQLYSLEKEAAEGVFRFIFLVNAGGAAATLGFMGASKEAVASGLTQAALLSFVVGLALIGSTYIYIFHHRSGIFEEFKKDFRRLLDGEIDFKKLTEADDNRAADSLLHYTLPYAAFFCFLGGTILGVTALLCGRS